MSAYSSHRLAVSIEFPAYFGTWPPPAGAVNPRVWFGSHDDIVYPDNVTPLKAKLHENDGVSSFKWEAQFFTNRYSISDLTLRVVDKDGDLSKAIADKLVDQVGTRRAIVRVFMVEKDEQIIDVGPFNRLSDSFGSQVICTYFMMNHTFDRGLITIECEDIVRTLVNTLFEDKDMVLERSAPEGATDIYVYDVDGINDEIGDCSFEHDEKYVYDPGNYNQPSACGYKRFSNTGEIFSHEKFAPGIGDVLKVKERGLFGTRQADNLVESDLEDKRNGPQIENVVYLEEFAPTMLYMLFTGRTSQSLNNARLLPPNYHLHVDPTWINEYSFFGDNSNNGSADNLRLRTIKNRPDNQCKRMDREAHSRPMRSVLHINRFGQIELVKQQATEKGSEQVKLDLSNIVEFSELSHIKSEIRNPVVIEYDKSILDGEYKRAHGHDDASSTKINQQTEEIRFQLETLYSGVNTSAQIDKIRIGIQDFYGHEHLMLTVSVLPSLRFQHLQIGHRVRVTIPKMRDDAQVEPYTNLDIDRVFMIQSVEFDPMTCGVRLQLIATLQRAEESSRTSNSFEIPDDKYPVDKINLLDVPAFMGNTFTDQSTVPTTYTFSGFARIDGGRYYIPGNLFINGTLLSRCVGTGDLEIWAMGELWVNGEIDTVGQGCHKPGTGQGALDVRPSPTSPTKGVREQNMIAEGAYFGSPNPVGGTVVRYFDSEDASLSGAFTTQSIEPIDPPSGEVEEVPELSLSNECGCLRGIPPSVSGTPSSGTATSYRIKVIRDEDVLIA